MNLLRRLLKQEPKSPVASLRGIAPEETQASQDGMRDHMLAELKADRRKRGVSDVAPTAKEAAPRM